jgi:hypothetical protein
MTVGHARRIIRKQIAEFCDAAERRSQPLMPGLHPLAQQLSDEQVVYWLTAAVFWWGTHADPFAVPRRRK